MDKKASPFCCVLGSIREAIEKNGCIFTLAVNAAEIRFDKILDKQENSRLSFLFPTTTVGQLAADVKAETGKHAPRISMTCGMG